MRLTPVIGAALTAAILVAAPAAAKAKPKAPARLSADTSAIDVRSTYGSGAFGSWGTDADGLPRYRYTLDQATAPFAAQGALGGSRNAWHQLGNDHVVADAYNHGYVELYHQDTQWQWMNRYDEGARQYAGGYGYLRVGGKVYSTLYADRSPGSDMRRDFGVGYLGRRTTAGPVVVSERVYAPYGDDPLLLHDVTLRNTSKDAQQASWFEYWGANPFVPGLKAVHRGLGSPSYDAANKTLSVSQLPFVFDLTPASLFAASLNGPVDGFEASTAGFFGNGTRGVPEAVAADRMTGSMAAPSVDSSLGQAMFAFRAPVKLAPGESVTLRYAYGYAHPGVIKNLVAKYRSAADPYRASAAAWKKFVPQVSLGRKYDWLAREAQWSAYTVKSASTWSECRGHHIISQGGYYQYDIGFQGAFRDPLQHMLPVIYSDPELAREVILYSATEQGRVVTLTPYAELPGCTRFDFGTSDDSDLWLLLSAAEYGLAQRDLSFFDKQVRWADGGSSSLWEHLKQAFTQQESQRSAHGYFTGATGDWSDLFTATGQMTESGLVPAQTAYVYPRLAELADARGDKAFAVKLRSTAAGLRALLRRNWTGKGWYYRGYSLLQQMGKGALYGEPQPWAMLAGVPSDDQERTLVRNIRRYLTGVGAPGGPSRIGSAQAPAADDPDVTETDLPAGVGNNHAVFVGGVWFAVNGWLTWALGEADGVVPDARALAFDELKRNTLAAHATVYPQNWSGVISVDDACRAWYSDYAAECGVGLSSAYNTQIMHQPAWLLFDVIKLAGVNPETDGYRITPRLPMATFSVRMRDVGVASRPRQLRGYIRPVSGGTLKLRVAAPPSSGRRKLVAYVNRRRVSSKVVDGLVTFNLPTRAGVAADWAVVATSTAAG